MWKAMLLGVVMLAVSAGAAGARENALACPNPPATAQHNCGVLATPLTGDIDPASPQLRHDSVFEQFREAATRVDGDTPLKEKTPFDLIVPLVQGSALASAIAEGGETFMNGAIWLMMLVGLAAGLSRRS